MNKILKANKLFMALSAVAMLLAGCYKAELDLSPIDSPAVPEGCPAVEFCNDNQTSFEIDPATPTFEVKLQRKATNAATYNIKVVNNEDDSFVVPSSVTFAEGEQTTTITVSIKESAKPATPLKLTLSFDDELLNPYTPGYKNYTATVKLIAWEKLGRGYWLGNIMNTLFSISAIPMYVEVERVVIGDVTNIRFTNPYHGVASDQDEMGAFNFYYYNEEGDLTDGDDQIFLTINKDNSVVLSTVTMGMDWGYGSMSFGQIFGNLSDNKSYPLGTFTPSPTGGVIEFPVGSLFLDLPAYNTVPCDQGSSYLFLSADDFAAAFEE